MSEPSRQTPLADSPIAASPARLLTAVLPRRIVIGLCVIAFALAIALFAIAFMNQPSIQSSIGRVVFAIATSFFFSIFFFIFFPERIEYKAKENILSSFGGPALKVGGPLAIFFIVLPTLLGVLPKESGGRLFLFAYPPSGSPPAAEFAKLTFTNSQAPNVITIANGRGELIGYYVEFPAGMVRYEATLFVGPGLERIGGFTFELGTGVGQLNFPAMK